MNANALVMSCLVAVGVLAPSWARADEAGSDPSDFSDPALEQEQRALDQSYRDTEREIDADYDDTLKFEARLKKQRLAFERELLDRRRQFLQSLESLPAGRRPEAWRLFKLEQEQRRREFLMKQEDTRERFDSDEEQKGRREKRHAVEDTEDTQNEQQMKVEEA